MIETFFVFSQVRLSQSWKMSGLAGGSVLFEFGVSPSLRVVGRVSVPVFRKPRLYVN